MKLIDEIQIKNAIRLIVGSLYDETIDIYEISKLLKDLEEEYHIEIEKQAKNPFLNPRQLKIKLKSLLEKK